MDPCTNECDTEDATQCDASDTIIQTCTIDVLDGCLKWEDTTTCQGATPTCDDAGGAATCVCADECDTPGATQCGAQGVSIQLCETQPDGCNDWVTDTVCQEPTPVCDDASGWVFGVRLPSGIRDVQRDVSGRSLHMVRGAYRRLDRRLVRGPANIDVAVWPERSFTG